MATAATLTPEPTTPPDPTAVPTAGAVSTEIVAGGVGSTQTMVVETFGESDGERDGRTSYSEGSVLMTYGAGSRVVRVTFDLDQDDLAIMAEEAEALAVYYRPPDAQLLTQETAEPGLVRRVYSSATLGALFADIDTGGRANDRYVEEIRIEPSTQRALSIEMALGDRP